MTAAPLPYPEQIGPDELAHELAGGYRLPCYGRTDLFYAPPGERPDARAVREVEAKRVCAECPARALCRAVARERGDLGVWGGETEEERAALGYPVGRGRINHSPFG